GDESLVVHRRPALPFSVFHGNRLGNQKWPAHAHDQNAELQWNHDGILEQLRRDLFARILDALGHAELRQGPADANHGHGPRGIASAFPQRESGSRFLRIMPAKTKKRAAPRKRVSSGSKGLAAVDHRLGAAELRRIAERIFKLSEADETEVDVSAVTSALTRFANNTIHQNVAEQGITISVRAVVDGRTARASTNKTDDESLRRVTVAELELAQVQPRNPDLLPMLGPQKLQKVARFNAKTAAATPVDRARAVARVCKMADEKKQTTAGIYSTGLSEFALADSRGLFEYYEDTRAEFSVTMLETDSSGWAKATSGNIGDIDPDALAASASQKSADSHEPKEIPAGHYTTILEPPAVLDLVGFLFYDVAGTSVLDQRSCFTGRMVKKLFGENISIWDDVYHPLQLGPPFDGEGLPRQR